ncbi:MAG: hypothetical protein PVF70_00665 [Anaerolineales bacterium]|jgi:hypothetical protein
MGSNRILKPSLSIVCLALLCACSSTTEATTALELADATSTPTNVPLTATETPVVASTPQQTATPESEEAEDELGPGGCTHNPDPVFTAMFTDLDMIDFITPIGRVTDSVVPHSYIWISQDGVGQAPEVPVYMPVDAVFSSYAYYAEPMRDARGGWIDVLQYMLVFQVSCEVNFKFDHLDRLVAELALLLPDEPSESTRTQELDPKPFLEAGTLIGYTTGTRSAHNWDFGVYNSARPNPFGNQERYQQMWNLRTILHADCPYAYYRGELREAVYALLPDGDCGSGSQDVPGTISGSWFEAQDYSPHDPIRPAVVVGIGVIPGSQYIQFWTEDIFFRVYPGAPTYLPPASVTTEHCYQSSDSPRMYAFMKLLSDMELTLVTGRGSCPAQIPTTHQVYFR